MQQDYPVPSLTSLEASAEAILHLTGQLAAKSEMVLITTLEGYVLAANKLAQTRLFRGNPNYRNSQLLDLIDEEFRPMAPKHLDLLMEKKKVKGFVKIKQPEAGSALLSFKTSVIKQVDHLLLHISAKFASTEVGSEPGKPGPVVSYNSILQNATEPLFIISPKGIIIDVNTLALDWIGYSKSDLTGKSVARNFELNPSEKSAFLKTLAKVADKGPQKFDWWIKTKEHSYLPVEITLNPGKYLGKPVVVGTARETSGRKTSSSDKLSDLAFVNTLVANIASFTEVEKMMQFTLQQIIQNTEIISGGIYWFDPQTQVAKLVSPETVSDEKLLQHQEISLDGSMIKQLTGPISRPIRYTLSRKFQQLFGKKS
jgi:PAS domain S-box-containing protein